jgi:hypothetical protein
MSTVNVTDSAGRTITLQKPSMLAQYRLVEALGETASNQVYMNMVLPLIYVTSIDGTPAPSTKKIQIEALIQRLDEHGLKAVVEGIKENFGNQDTEEDKTAIKN